MASISDKITAFDQLCRTKTAVVANVNKSCSKKMPNNNSDPQKVRREKSWPRCNKRVGTERQLFFKNRKEMTDLLDQFVGDDESFFDETDSEAEDVETLTPTDSALTPTDSASQSVTLEELKMGLYKSQTSKTSR